LSEYRVAAGVAPSFQLGELWAAMHARGVLLGHVGARQLAVGSDGRAGIARALSVQMDVALEPERMASDLTLTLRGESPDLAHALLAGYVRVGYEWADHRQPGFTDAVLDLLQYPTANRPVRSMLEGLTLPHALGADLRAVEGHAALVPRRDAEAPRAWWQAPVAAFEFLVALMVAGVDCSRIYARDARLSTDAHPLHRWLLSGSSRSDPVEPPPCPPGSELSFALITVLRNSPATEPYQLNDILFWVRKVLVEFPDEQAQRFGDLLIRVSLHCAALFDRVDPSVQPSSYIFAQQAIIFLEYTARGSELDEARLSSLTHALYGLSWYPKPFQSWRATQYQIAMWNSWLQTYRSLAGRSFAEANRTKTGPLRSAALRGLYTARRALPLGYRMATSRDPELAIVGLTMLRGFVKSHAHLLSALWEFAADERRATGASGWLPLFEDGSNGTQLASELAWSAGFLSAAAEKDFFIETARQHLQAGAPFIAGPDELDPAPPSRA
jgi:hypothetical protein